jgi:hypothetical protein
MDFDIATLKSPRIQPEVSQPLKKSKKSKEMTPHESRRIIISNRPRVPERFEDRVGFQDPSFKLLGSPRIM